MIVSALLQGNIPIVSFIFGGGCTDINLPSNFIFGHWHLCTLGRSLYTFQCLSIDGNIFNFDVASVRTNIKTQL